MFSHGELLTFSFFIGWVKLLIARIQGNPPGDGWVAVSTEGDENVEMTEGHRWYCTRMTMYDTIYLTNEDSPMFTQMRCDTMSKPGEMSNGYYPGTHCLIKPKVIKDRFHVNHLIPSSTLHRFPRSLNSGYCVLYHWNLFRLTMCSSLYI